MCWIHSAEDSFWFQELHETSRDSCFHTVISVAADTDWATWSISLKLAVIFAVISGDKHNWRFQVMLIHCSACRFDTESSPPPGWSVVSVQTETKKVTWWRWWSLFDTDSHSMSGRRFPQVTDHKGGCLRCECVCDVETTWTLQRRRVVSYLTERLNLVLICVSDLLLP